MGAGTTKDTCQPSVTAVGREDALNEPASSSTSCCSSSKRPCCAERAGEQDDETWHADTSEAVSQNKVFEASSGSPSKRGGKSPVNRLTPSEENEMWLEVLDGLEQYDETVTNGSRSHVHHHHRDDDEVSMLGDDHIDHEFHGCEVDCEFDEHLLDKTRLLGVWLDLKRRVLPSLEQSQALIIGFTRLYANEPTLVHLDHPGPDKKLIVVGDLHGHFGDCMHIFNEYGDPSDEHDHTLFIFNGDFVDRGMWGPEVLLSLYCLKLLNPRSMHLNRGNHEDASMNMLPRVGFKDHCHRAWPHHGDHMYKLAYESFKQLPLCHVVRNDLLVTHGGLPLDPGVTLAEIAAIDRRRAVPTHTCNLFGYAKRMQVTAMRPLEAADDGEEIPAGTVGVLLGKKTPVEQGFAIVEFSLKHREAKACVKLGGCPALEKDVQPIYKDEEHARQAREDRVFSALLWSDPGSVGAPSMRGAGAEFNLQMTEAFLKTNGLNSILRSHQKKPEGYLREQVADSGQLLVATVFSASNYPAGAGEQGDLTHGNMASVVVMAYPRGNRQLWQCLEQHEPWNESYKCMSYWTGAQYSVSTKGLFNSLHDIVGLEDEDPKARALEQITLLIYVHRGLLLRFFNSADHDQTGMVTKDVFVQAMKVCLIHVQDFPWESLAPHIATFDSRGLCRYAAFLGRFQNILCHRLAEHWHGRALLRCVGDDEITADTLQHAQVEWDKIDKAKKGILTFQDLRPLLASRSTTLSQQVEDERVFSILSSLDSTRSGYVKRSEFCEAVTGQGGGAWAQIKVESEFDSRAADECWSAVQGVLVTLSSTRLRLAQIFKLFDSDKSDIISRKEFKEGLRRLLQGSQLLSSMEEWEPLFWQLLDNDESGFISPVELYMALAVEDTHNDVIFARMTTQRFGRSNPATPRSEKSPMSPRERAWNLRTIAET